MSVHKSWRLLPAVLGAAALTFTVLPVAASADHTVINDTPEDQVESVRWPGETRYDTAAKLAVEGTAAAVSTSATSAILATGENFPDALAGSYLSGQVGGPILLTEKDSIPAETLSRLTGDEESDLTEVETVYLLGGPDAIDQSVVDELEDADFTVERIAGETRIDTAAMIATDAPDATVGEVDGVPTAIVARADTFPDALVTGAAARNAELPLLLTNTDDLPQVTIDTLEELGIEQVLLPGGQVAISQDVEQELTDLGYDVERFDGETRRDTAIEFARYSVDTLGFTTDEIGLARGDNFPDALALAPFAGREAFPIVLTESPTSLGTETAVYLQDVADCRTDTLYIPGGPVAVSADVESLARQSITTDEDCAGIDNEDPTLVGAFVVAGEDDNDNDDTNAIVGRELPGPGDDVVNAIFDEDVTGEDTAPEQFTHIAEDGTETEATSVEFDDSEQVLLGFPADTVTVGEGSIEYTRSGNPADRVYDLAGNEAVNNTTVQIAEETTVDSTDDAVDANIGDGECATADGDCTLRAAVQEANFAADYDIIIVAPGTYALTIEGADEDNAATGDLDVTDGVSILGTDAATTIVDADGLNDDRAFDISNGLVAIEALTVTNGEVTGDTDRGGAIRATGETVTLRISDSVISNSTAPQAGGGIENTGADVSIEGTDFTDNSTGDTPGNGGALHAAGGTTDVTGGTVSTNTAEEGGGFWVGGGTLAVDMTTFDQNVATGGTTDAGERQGGGAIFNLNGSLDVIDATFTANTAEGEDADGDAGSGGAIMSTTTETNTATTTVTTSTFTGNVADRAGGAIENDGATTLEVTDTTFDGNTATGDNSAGNGGAIHTVGTTTVDGDTDTNVANNNAAVEGGAFWVGGGATLTVTSTSFDANTASGGDAETGGERQGGGAIYNDGATLDVDDAEFTANTAVEGAGSGGAILNAAGSAAIDSSSFEGNQADRAGGAIENDGGAMLTVTASTFDTNAVSGTNSEAGNGGAIHDGGSTTTITDEATTFTGNTAVEGGALWVSGTMSVTDATLTDNTATTAGSAFYNSGGTLTLDGVNATFEAALPLPAPGEGITLLEDEGDGTTTTITEAGDNTLDDGDTDNPTCNVVIGDEANGNVDDDNTCFEVVGA